MNLGARYDRNIGLFGEEGQKKLRQTKVAVVGIGGLGSPLVQHLALLGVGSISLIDHDELDDTSRNRLIGAHHDDRTGTPKVDLMKRLINEINPEVDTLKFGSGLINEAVFDDLRKADWVFGCVDHDGPRFVLNEICAAYSKSYTDLASDIPNSKIYGGRVCTAWDGNGCLHCFNQLDMQDVRKYLSSEQEREEIARIYGVPTSALGLTGPAVSPINGVVASLGATEFMVARTGLRSPTRLLEFQGHISKVLVSRDIPEPDCYYCGMRGRSKETEVQRYLKIPHLRRP